MRPTIKSQVRLTSQRWRRENGGRMEPSSGSAHADSPSPPAPGARLLRLLPKLAAVVFSLLYMGYFLSGWDPATGLTKHISFGPNFDSGALPALRAIPHVMNPDLVGYDGQFYAQIALDPTLRYPALARALDNPPYRARRVLLPWTAYIFGLGQPRWVLNAYVWQYLLFWAATGFLLTRWIPLDSFFNLARWSGCMFASGMLRAMDRALPDAASMLFVLGALYFLETRREWRAAAVLALAAFARDINVLGAVMFGPPPPGKKQAWLLRAGQMAAIVIPLAVWIVYLNYHFSGGDGLGARNFLLPGMGFVNKAVSDTYDLWVHPNHHDIRMEFLLLATMTFRLVYLCVYRDWRDPVWRLGAIYVLLALCLGDAVWEGYFGAYQRVLIPLTFAFNLRLLSAKHGAALAFIGNIDAWALVITSVFG